MQRTLSELVNRNNLSLEATIRLWRGQTLADPRQNKALSLDHLDWLLHGYDLQALVLTTIRDGVRHSFKEYAGSSSTRQANANHKSAQSMENALIRSIREGQGNGTYMVVDETTARRWEAVQVSPFGCVPKNDADPRFEARVIHNLSHPHGQSVNDQSDPSDLPPLSFEPISTLARHIEAIKAKNPQATVKIKRGDVKSAFRNVFGHASVCAKFAGRLERHDAVVIDLALPFGWTDSLAHYQAFGGAITFLVRRESPASMSRQEGDHESFFCYTWVDDHVLVEEDRQNRLELCETALRLAMLAVLGSRAINEKKFRSWTTQARALGLDWNTTTRTVSMPPEKLAKALRRVRLMIATDRISRTSLSELLGSLRHVCACIRPARPFFQRLAALHRGSPYRGHIPLSHEARIDLLWFEHILMYGHLQGIPLSMFDATPEPDVHIYMDASNTGLCALHPATRQFLRVQFDDEEREKIAGQQFSINVREQLSAVFALLCWGASWIPDGPNKLTHVRFWIDNKSAVSWCNSLHSREPLAQELNRVIGAVEVRWRIRVSAEHLPGACNYLADLGSRGWTGERAKVWQELTTSWSQRRSLAESSLLQYRTTWNQWRTFCSKLGISAWLPANQPQRQSLLLALFGIHCWTGGLPAGRVSAGSVRSKISHVRWYHHAYANFDPHLSPGHSLAFKGMQRTHGQPQQRKTVTFAMLQWLLEHLDPCNAQHRVIGGAALLGYFFLLRSAEYLEVKGERRIYTLQVRDVIVRDQNGTVTTSAGRARIVEITLRGSKNDQVGTGVTRQLERSGHPTVCPVRAALVLHHQAATMGSAHDSPICLVSPSSLLSATGMAKALRCAAKSTGADPSKFSCHSLRSGGATALLSAGVDSTIVMLHGRWKSDVFQRYTRHNQDTARQLATRMASGQPSHEIDR